MSETKLSSMTPEDRALACHRCRFADEESNVGMLTIAIRQAESEAASAAFLRGFEAAREASAKIASNEMYTRLAADGTYAAAGSAEWILAQIRALTPADARASSIPGAASETVIHRQSSEGAQPPGSSSAGSRDSAPPADASAPGSECPVATRSAGESFDPTTESAHEMRDADRGGSDAAAGY